MVVSGEKKSKNAFNSLSNRIQVYLLSARSTGNPEFFCEFFIEKLITKNICNANSNCKWKNYRCVAK